MATLRDPFFAPNTVSLDEMEQLQNSGKGSLRRGWETGRIGSERNALGIDEVAARAAGDIQRADTLRAQNDALGQAQARVAPQTQKVEDIDSIGTGLNWFGGAVGQGLASMAEPVAAATALGGVGRVAGMLPGTAGKIGRAVGTVGGPLAAYGINQRQMAGEFANNAMEDPELMARTAPQDLYRTANIVGGVAGLLDTAAPAIIGRQLTGAGLRASMKAMGAGMGPAAKTVLGMGGEAIAEPSQGEVGRYALGQLNPNRDTSEDASNRLNEAAGGAAGGGPLIAAGAYADAGYRRVGQAADMVGTKAGETVDLLKEKYDGSALQGGVDKAMAAGKQKAGDMVDLLDRVRGDDGNISLERLAELGKQGVGKVTEGAADLRERFEVSLEEQDLLQPQGPTPPDSVMQSADPAVMDAWINETDAKRANVVATRLGQMAENDPAASDLFDQVTSDDPAVQAAALAKGSEYVLQHNELEQMQAQGNRAAAAAGEFAAKAGSALGRGAMAVGKVAADFGKAAIDGAKGARKQNLQGGESDSAYDAWTKRRDEMRGGALPLDEQVARHAAANRALDVEAIKNDPKKAAAMQRSRNRAELFGEIMDAEARSARAKFGSRITPDEEAAFGLVSRHTGYELAGIADSWGLRDGGTLPSLNAGTRQGKVLTMALDRVANSMRVALRDRADPVLTEMQAQFDPQSAPLFDYVRERITSSGTPAGRKSIAETRANMANELVMMLPAERQAEIMRGEAARTAAAARGEKTPKSALSRAWLLESLEALANGHQSPQFRKTFGEAFGEESVAKMLDHISETGSQGPRYGTAKDNATYAEEDAINEDGEFIGEGEVTGTSGNDFEQRQNEKTVRKGAAPKLYGFYKTADQSVRSSDETRDPFAPLKKMSKAEEERASEELREENATRAANGLTPRQMNTKTRPNMYNSSEAGQRQLNEHIARMEKSAGPRYMVSARSALDVMDDLGYEPAKVLSVYRDYLRQDATREGVPLVRRKELREQANLADRAIVDQMAGFGAEKNAKQMSPLQRRAAVATQKRIAEYEAKQGKSAVANLGPGDRMAVMEAAQDYLNAHHIAVAEMVTSRDPGQIELGELVSFGRSGARTWDFAMDGRTKDEGPDPQVIDGANLITFQSDVMGRTGEDRSLHIPAARLVGWVRAQRPFDSAEEGDKKSVRTGDENDAYLEDLMEGITAIMGSGMVDAKLPTRMNAKGEWEAFAAPKKERFVDGEGKKRTKVTEKWGSTNGIPKSLQLETMTYGNMEFGRKKNPKKGKEELVPGSDKQHQAVAEEQDRDWFVVDDLEGLEPEPTYSSVDEPRTFVTPNADRARRTTMYAERPSTSTGARQRRGPQMDEAGNVVRPAAYAGETSRALGTADPLTDGDDATPLDFQKKQKQGEVPDEYADQRYRSGTSKATDGIGTEPKMSAMKKAEERGGELMRLMRNDFAAGMEKLESRMRTAARPSHVEKDRVRVGDEDFRYLDKPGAAGLVGGAHYIAPLAHALSRDNIDRFDGDEHDYLNFKRAEVADFILKSPDLTVPQKIALTKAMAPKTSRARIALGNYATILQKAALEKAPVAKMKVEPAASPAPEVASAGLPKGSANQRGADWSDTGARKLSAMSTKVHNDLGRDGFAATHDSPIRHFNRQGGNARIASQAEMDEAKAYVRKVLGPAIKVEFKDITGYSGEWLDAEQAIHISTTAAAGTLSTAYHEALHGFFSKFVENNPRALETLKSLAENDKIMGRVAALLAGHPAAIDQLKSGEERLAYIYQFWAAGQLDLPMGKARTTLQKLRKFFRRVLGLVSDSERAVALFEAFHQGQLAEPSAAGRVISKILDEGTGIVKARRSIDGLAQWLAAKTMPAESILAASESKVARDLAKEFFTNPGDEKAAGAAEGYLNARRRMAARYKNSFAQTVNGMSARDMTDVAKLLQAETELSDIAYAPHRESVAKIRKLLQRFHKYMSVERGLDLGHAGEKYYPRVWSTDLLHSKKDEFLKMLATHYDAVLTEGAASSRDKLSKDQVAQRIWQGLIERDGVNDKLDAQRQDGVLAPFFASKENRTLAWLQGEHVEPFLQKNLVATLSRYFHQGARAAEYAERFGVDGEVLESKLMEVQAELTEASQIKLKRGEFKNDEARAKWVSRQFRDVSESVGAMEGTLGKDISPAWRKANSWMTVYQNVRLLPLSLFASFVDPLGMVARGATMREAYDGFLRGMKEVVTTWGDLFREEPKERQADQWEKLAEHIGAVDAALFSHFVSDEYSSVYMERGAKKINDTMFTLNGMEAWNRGMRVAGVKNAVAFIERHAGGADKVHSKRWLQELGLDPSNIPLDTDGQLITDKNVLMQQKGIGKSQAEREIDAVHYAINRWVEGAVLTPNAAQRPAWGSDPHYSMFFHLKQFSYSFHQTILKRAVSEMNHGNLAPLGAFVWYIPVMIAADVTKGLIQGGGELPAYMKGYDAGDWVMHGAQRGGLLSVGQIGVDAGQDVASLAGPGVEQMIDAMRAPLSETTIKALPAHGLYANMLR